MESNAGPFHQHFSLAARFVVVAAEYKNKFEPESSSTFLSRRESFSFSRYTSLPPLPPRPLLPLLLSSKFLDELSIAHPLSLPQSVKLTHSRKSKDTNIEHLTMSEKKGGKNVGAPAKPPNKSQTSPSVKSVRLQSTAHRDLLDIIDTLRSQGLSRHVDLPQIIVCGDQSSGKSSALEAISGMSFPTKDNLCTRFATELILRRSSITGVKICIIPGDDRSNEEKKRLSEFAAAFENEDVGKVVDAAKTAMGLTGNGKVFSNDILRIEISGPAQPHLTIVDLPGLFLAGNRDQSDADARVVEELVLSYMKKPRTIILAVVSAKSDFALQQVTRHARIQDPTGSRTLGLITKPDTLDIGSDSEKFYVELAQNKDVKFQLGWHVLRNRSYATRESSAAQRNVEEAEFFSKGVWASLKASQKGAAALQSRLSDVLRDQILLQLPTVLSEIGKGIEESKRSLKLLGESRASLAEQRRYLVKAGSEFSSLMRAAVDGTYTDPFFKLTNNPSVCRLRAFVQNELAEFATRMTLKGHALIILESGQTATTAKQAGSTAQVVQRDEYLKTTVMSLIKKSRGRELPGTYNPLIVGELFAQQCKPWKRLILELIKTIKTNVSKMIAAALFHVTDGATGRNISTNLINPQIQIVGDKLRSKVEELLEPHLSGHPITYNHYLTDNFQKVQGERNSKLLEAKLLNLGGIRYSGNQYTLTMENAKEVAKSLATVIKTDIDKFACSMAVDMAEAYYKVAIKKIIDDVSVLAIEQCLMQALPGLFSSDVACNLDDETVMKIAGESADSIKERSLLEKKLAVLKKGMLELERARNQHSSILGEAEK